MDLLTLNKIGEYISKQRDFINTNIKVLEKIKPVNLDGTIILTQATTKEYTYTEYITRDIDNIEGLLSLLDEITSAVVLVRVHSINTKVQLIFNTKDKLLYDYIYNRSLLTNYIKLDDYVNTDTRTIAFAIDDSIDGMVEVIKIMGYINGLILDRPITETTPDIQELSAVEDTQS